MMSKVPMSDDAEDGMRFERMVSDLSGGFAELSASPVQAHIEGGLRTVVEFLGAEAGRLIEAPGNVEGLRITGSYPPLSDRDGQRGSVDRFAWDSAQMERGEVIVLPSSPDDGL